eukprot:2685845-Rhodomonas_salina.2
MHRDRDAGARGWDSETESVLSISSAAKRAVASHDKVGKRKDLWGRGTQHTYIDSGMSSVDSKWTDSWRQEPAEAPRHGHGHRHEGGDGTHPLGTSEHRGGLHGGSHPVRVRTARDVADVAWTAEQEVVNREWMVEGEDGVWRRGFGKVRTKPKGLRTMRSAGVAKPAQKPGLRTAHPTFQAIKADHGVLTKRCCVCRDWHQISKATDLHVQDRRVLDGADAGAREHVHLRGSANRAQQPGHSPHLL